MSDIQGAWLACAVVGSSIGCVTGLASIIVLAVDVMPRLKNLDEEKADD